MTVEVYFENHKKVIEQVLQVVTTHTPAFDKNGSRTLPEMIGAE